MQKNFDKNRCYDKAWACELIDELTPMIRLLRPGSPAINKKLHSHVGNVVENAGSCISGCGSSICPAVLFFVRIDARRKKFIYP